MAMLRPVVFVAILALLCAPPGFAKGGRPDRPPNIVLIVGDDHGYPYAGFMGDEIVETPNLDRLAEEGTTFTRAFSSASVCQPALQTLLTGLHTRSWHHQRIRTWAAVDHPIRYRAEVQHYVTLPRQLARQGYRSFQGGKHMEGDFAMAGYDAGTATYLPASFTGMVGHDTFARPSLSPMQDFLDGVEEDEPFFLFLAPMLPHVPFDASADLLARYLWRGFTGAAVHYYANITRLDQVVGRVVDALEERGLRDASLIIYVSDNGWEQDPYVHHFLGWLIGGARGKMSIHELGFRTPLVFNWPGKVPQRKVMNDLVTFEDLHATLLQYAGAPIPPDHRGNSLLPRIEGWAEPARDQVIGVQDFFRVRQSEYDPSSGPGRLTSIETASFLRTERWRYIEWLHRRERALFRIEEDPFERNDVKAGHPELLALFAERTREWREELTQPASWMDLMGRLTSEDGRPAAGLRLWLERAGESAETAQWQVFSDDRGFFRFPNVPAGEYTLIHEIEAPELVGRWRRIESEPVTESMEVDLVGWQTSPFLSIQLPGEAPPARADGRRPGTIEIKLRARGGTETSGLPVHLWGWTERGFVEQQVLSGPDGFVAVDQLPAGFYLIRITTPDDVRARARWAHLRPGTSEFLEIELRRQTRRHVPAGKFQLGLSQGRGLHVLRRRGSHRGRGRRSLGRLHLDLHHLREEHAARAAP